MTITVNRQSETKEVIGFLRTVARELPRETEVEVVGVWVWLHTPEKPPDETRKKLSKAGFHWNRTRKVWQHPCGKFSKASPRDPRMKYDVIRMSDLVKEDK